MARRQRVLVPQRHARLEIVPMIDIMMFLLVFFVMITLSMIPNGGLTVDLPGAAHATALALSPVTLALDKGGHIHIGADEIPLEQLKARLAAPDGQNRSVIIAADRALDFQRVMIVMDMARSAGVRQIGLAAKSD